MTTARELEDRFESGIFPKRPVTIVRGEGARLFDDAGREYLDFGASFGAMNTGHGNSFVARAVAEQMQRLSFVGQTYYNDVRARLLERLVGVAPQGLAKAFLCSSGTEAVEAGIKFARGTLHRPGIVAARGAFHGRTFGALSATWKKDYREPFEPLVPGFTHVTFNDVEALKAAVTRDTACLLLEPVQGEGGVHVATPEYLRAARDVATDSGAWLVFDEIQTGFGRTGRMWALEHAGVVPDMMCVAKSIAGGVPMGAVLGRAECFALPKAAHGNTFGGNMVAAAAALAVLDFMEKERVVENAARRGDELLAGLRALAARESVREVRGLGLMCAVETRQRATPYLQGLLERGILALPTGSTVIRLLPPLVVTSPEIERCLAALREVLP